MATRSTIALEFADGTVQQVYCHWDGYLAHNGLMLLEHYSNPFILRDLIDLGGLSSLRPTIGTKHAFSQFDLPKEEVEDFINRTANMCTFYARDRGEKLVVHKFVDFQDYLAHHSYEEYEYILRKDGNWYVQCHDDPYVTLKSAIADEQDRIAQEETAE
jgi:hypothetical protein